MSEILTIEEAIERLRAANDILLLCHKNPDGDTLGSAGAMYWALKQLGKRAAVICSDPIPERYAYMELCLYTEDFEPAYIVAVDVAGLQLFGEATVGYGERADLCIDHHPSNSGYAKALLLDGEAAATAELIYELLLKMDIAITPCIASCLYTGVATDTGCFKFANTTPKTHAVAAKLMELGADYQMLNTLLFESKSRPRLAIERRSLENLQYYYGGQCAVVALSREEIEESGADSTDLEGITAIPRMIEGVKVGITVRQQPTGSYKVSVRTSRDVDACAIAARLGGGGHKQAAGCEIIGGMKYAVDALLAETAKVLGLTPEQSSDEGARTC